MPHRFFDALRARDWDLFDALRIEMPQVDLSGLRSHHTTLLHVAVEHGMVGGLLERMGSLYPDFLSAQDRWGLGALHWAAARGDGVVELLAAGADAHAMDHQAQTPLFLAAQNGRLNAVVALLGARAQDGGNWEGDTAAMRAAEGGHADVLRALIGHGIRMPIAVSDWSPDRDPVDVDGYREDVRRAIVGVALADLSRAGVASPPSLLADLQSAMNGNPFAPVTSTLTGEQRRARIQALIDVYGQQDHDVRTRPARAVAAAEAAVTRGLAAGGSGMHYTSVGATRAPNTSLLRQGGSTSSGAGLG